MFKKSDREFLAVLDDGVSAEKRIGELARARKWNAVTAVALATLIYAHVLFLLVTYKNSISLQTPFGVDIPAPMPLMPALFIPVLLINAIKAVGSHCELRTLLMFRKLRDDKSVVNP